MIPDDVLAPLTALHELRALEGRGDHLLYLTCSFPCDPRILEARRALLAALLRHHAPLRLQVADPEGDAADLDGLGLARDGASRLLFADADLEALDRVSLHVGAWLMHKSQADDLYVVLGDRDPFRSMVLDELVRRGEASLVVASFYDDREWLIAGLI